MESFEQLFKQYTPMIHSIMRSLNIYKNKEEFFQVGLVGLWEASKRFDADKGSFTSYAYTYIRGLFLTEMRKSNKQSDHNIPAKEEFWEYIEDECSICPLEKEFLLCYCTISRLTENQTKWVLYHCLSGLSIMEISEREKVSLSAVKSWRAGAKEKLRKAVEECMFLQ
ncbi:sigma-70 family RNA polymerase sigma factor [Bacillus sp. T33-2]|uniref:sigma-70 family RNA polymerase sigma factor n=1 Tax=Bacillus sp. T33-2 TaxID=2054168 RepID=UPI000C785F22|nr:sigma-70 family RNA polymerase sigma factor [Bacillus sp. T33-2]PLR95893.1 RNA polymerase subunit sigma-24 [Bacillus sp. T33-2]